MPVQSAVDKSRVLEFDLFSIHAQCVVAFVASIALLQKTIALIDNRDVEILTWPDFIAAAQDAPTFKSQNDHRSLELYFTIEDGEVARNLDARNGRTIRRVGDLLVQVIENCQKNGSLTLVNQKDVRSGEVLRLLAQMASYVEKQVGYHASKKVDEKRSHLGDLIEAVQKKQKSRALTEFIESLYGKSGLSHPAFPSLQMLDTTSLKAELLDLQEMKSDAGIHGGIFAILREARGWSENDERSRNLIVRDILWLLPQEVDGEEPARQAGIYVSATDHAAFTVDRIVPEENMLHLVGHMENPEATQRMKLILTKFDYGHDLEHRVGVLTGVTPKQVGQVLGSWKIVAIRPAENTRILNCLIAQLYQTSIELCSKLVTESRMCGVLYSNYLKEMQPDLKRRHVALRSLLKDDPETQERLSTSIGGYIRAKFKDDIKPLIKTLHSISPQDERYDDHVAEQANYILDAVGLILLNNWTYVSPAQFSIHKENRQTRSVDDIDVETKGWLTHLLETESVYESINIR
ncbi:hypothetical protein N185_16165 [Sinorhizobium sp. GW3]|nr:hypothetical protein N185_16165 [Sinorhizobium sp. GW3]